MNKMMHHPAFHQQCIPLVGRTVCIMFHPPYRYAYHQYGNNRLVKHIRKFRVYSPIDEDFVHPAS